MVIDNILNKIEERKKNKEIKVAYEKINEINDLKTVAFACSRDENKSKKLAYEIFKRNKNIINLKENINTEYDISEKINEGLLKDKSILFMSTNCEKIGAISRITQFIRPQIGIITDIESKTLETENMENISKAKYEIIEKLPTDGIAIFNYEDKYVKKLADKTFKEKILYGIDNEKLDFNAYDLEELDDKISFIISNKKEKEKFESNIKSKENVLDILGAVVVCNTLGLNLKDISLRIKTINEN